jgi:predicted nicotinamide N-methyase
MCLRQYLFALNNNCVFIYSTEHLGCLLGSSYFSSMTITPALLTTFAPLTTIDTTGICIHQAFDLYALWAALENCKGAVCPPPFWGVAWPGARMVSSYLLSNPELVAGKSLLDIGCGCGIVAIAAAKAGARMVVANDIDPDALTATSINAAANNVIIVTDMRNMVTEPFTEPFDVVIASDMFYEASITDPFFTLLKKYAASGALVIIADGNRPFTPREHLTLMSTKTVAVDRAVEERDERTVSLFRLHQTAVLPTTTIPNSPA